MPVCYTIYNDSLLYSIVGHSIFMTSSMCNPLVTVFQKHVQRQSLPSSWAMTFVRWLGEVNRGWSNELERGPHLVMQKGAAREFYTGRMCTHTLWAPWPTGTALPCSWPGGPWLLRGTDPCRNTNAIVFFPTQTHTHQLALFDITPQPFVTHPPPQSFTSSHSRRQFTDCWDQLWQVKRREANWVRRVGGEDGVATWEDHCDRNNLQL